MECGSVEEITKSFGLSQEDVEVWSKRSGQSSGKLANPGFNKTEAGCVCMCVGCQRMQFAANNQPEFNQWLHRDIDAMCRELDTAPVYIDADRSIDLLLLLFGYLYRVSTGHGKS